MIYKICRSDKNQMFLVISIMHKLLNKELRINYVSEIRNGCSLCEQAFCRFCVDPLIFDRWGYTKAKVSDSHLMNNGICRMFISLLSTTS